MLRLGHIVQPLVDQARGLLHVGIFRRLIERTLDALLGARQIIEPHVLDRHLHVGDRGLLRLGLFVAIGQLIGGGDDLHAGSVRTR